MVIRSLLHHACHHVFVGSGDLFTYFTTKPDEEGLAMSENRISREDLENKFKALQDDIQGRAADKKQSAIAVASVVGGVVVLIAFLFGRRSGRKSGSRVEFRRF